MIDWLYYTHGHAQCERSPSWRFTAAKFAVLTDVRMMNINDNEGNGDEGSVDDSGHP